MHLPALGELDCVACQIEQNLPQAAGIAAQLGGQIGRRFDDKFNVFSLGLRGQQHADFVQQMAE